MSLIDLDNGLSSDAERLSAILSKPAEEEKKPEVPVEPKAVKTPQRNTVTQRDSAPPEETSADEGEGEEPKSAIEAPSSWNEEARQAWAKLPDDVKVIVTQRENDRDNATKQRLQELAETRKKTESVESQNVQALKAYEQRLVILAKQLEANIPAEFQHLKTQQDLLTLSVRDPAAYTRFTAWRDAAVGVRREIEALEQQKAEESVRKLQSTVDEEAKTLLTKWPEMGDQVKGPVLRKEISETLSSFGFTSQEIDGIVDHRILLFTKQFLEAKSKVKTLEDAAKKLDKKLPKVALKPSAGEDTGRGSIPSRGQLTKVARSGDMGLTAAAIDRILGAPQG